MFKIISLILGLTLTFLSISPLIAQEEEIEWIWGEVLSVDERKSEIKVNYLDYETGEEKEIIITCDPETIFENVSSISEIKVGDSISCDYVIKEGKNIAKFISVEEIPFEAEP